MPDSSATVTTAQFEALWEWFGTTISRIRHDKVVLELWTQGFIMGFLTKEESDALLIREAPGTFLLRFSSQAAGALAIAYTSVDGQQVLHYLIRKNDVNVAQSLAKFLLDKPFFSTLLQTIPSWGEVRVVLFLFSIFFDHHPRRIGAGSGRTRTRLWRAGP